MSVPNVASLPKCTSAIGGDIAFVASPPSLWDCVASHWISIPCTPFQSGQVAYSNQTQSLIACVEGQWTPIALDGGAGPQGPQGATGATGATGPAGAVSIVVQTSEPSGANCANGGTKISSGLDTNADGALESNEVTSVSYVCNGATGATGDAGPAGENSLVNVTPENPGTNCSTGGQRVDVGLDVNADGILETNEIQNTVYVCNGLTGPAADAGAPPPPTAPLGAPDGHLYVSIPSVSGSVTTDGFVGDFEAEQFGFSVSNVGGSDVWTLGATLVVSAPVIQLAQAGTTIPELTFSFTRTSRGSDIVYAKLTARNAVLAVTSVASSTTEQAAMTMAVTFSAIEIQDFIFDATGTARGSETVRWDLTTSTGNASASTTAFDFAYGYDPDLTSSTVEVEGYALSSTTNPVFSVAVGNINQPNPRPTSALLNYFLAAARGATFPTGALDVYRRPVGTGTLPTLVGNYALTNTQVQSFAIQGSNVNLALTPASYGYTAAP